MNHLVKKLLPEINEILSLEQSHPDLVRTTILDKITVDQTDYPIYGLTIGSQDKSAPTLGLFGGVHGLERIGTQVLLSYIYTLNKRLNWDLGLRQELEKTRIVCIPIVNPWGLAHFRRSNKNGVDLMRNAPIEAEEKPTFLVGGHRISSKIPWFRGSSKADMEIESSTLINFVEKEMFQAKASVSLDFHSGFGVKDQIWHPYAKSRNPFPHLKQFNSLFDLFVETYPHHVYKIEPQSLNYTTHGDLWDYAIHKHQESPYKDQTFIPLTLELGSWNWIKKNPVQLFSMFGLFNPVKKHRYSRTMRRHVYLIDFLIKALRNEHYWNQ